MNKEYPYNPVPQQGIHTLRDLNLGSCDEEEGESFSNVILGNQYKLKKLLRIDPHAKIYQVWSISRNCPVEELEARIYVINDIPHKLRQYRLKSIKRLSSRTELEVRINGQVVVLYKVDNTSAGNSKRGMHSEPAPQDDEQNEKTQKAKTQGRSDRQRETARLRQLERRKLNRQKKHQKETGSNQSDSAGIANDEEETLYVLLHLAYNDRPELRQQLPPASRAVLEKYLRSQPLKFEDADEMDAFMAIKLHEIEFLGRQEKKLPDIEERRKNEYADLLKQQLLLPRGSDAYKSMQTRITIAQHKWRVIQYVQQLLPEVIGDATEIHRELYQRLKLARELNRDIEEFQALSAEHDRLQRKVVFYEKISQQVVPGSGPYAEAITQLQAAKKILKLFDARIEEIPMEVLEPMRQDYKNLLVMPMEKASDRISIADYYLVP